MRTPRSTYRLQITKDFTLQDAAARVPYLKHLGADWIYLSPLLSAAAGSMHGYDVVDPGTVDASRGGEAGLRMLADAAHAAGLGVLVDIVPNHMGVADPRENAWWWDLLMHGTGSRFARAFDVDWEAGGGRVILPVLGGADDLARLELRTDDGGGHVLALDGREYPVAPGTGPADRADNSPQAVHDRQHYRLAPWQVEASGLNYRRFFAVSTLAGIRVEDPEVFDESHAEILRWVRAGWVDGLRIDHPDGLKDPAGYLRRLSEATGGIYVLVEKILEPGENLPADWACAGTTGYDSLGVVDRALVHPAGAETLTALDTRLRGSVLDYADLCAGTKRAVADGILNSEIQRLARLVVAETGLDHGQAADALAEITAAFSVYRSYLPQGRADLDAAAARAAERKPGLPYAQVHRILAGTTEAAYRFQQTSGMIMAKGVEDCAFFRATRLVSLTEVGADPDGWSVDAAAFHSFMAERQELSPAAMNAYSTHDTKRGEDTRARISTLAEFPAEWTKALGELQSLAPLPDGPLANLLWQSVLGAWPAGRDRLRGYAEKAAREAGNSTSWLDPDAEFESVLAGCVDAVFDNAGVGAIITRMDSLIAAAARNNILAGKALQLTIPGVPDVYQGSEREELSLTDPDNRRAVDFDAAEAGLAALAEETSVPAALSTPAAKQLITHRALALRNSAPDAFTGYTPLYADGPAADHLLGFDRGGAITLATVLPRSLADDGGWRGTVVGLPRVRNVLTGTVHSGTVEVAEVLAGLPAALLIAEGEN
ncbi:MAG: malto-oligosyltrehalose synthase [Actinomycetales bacterium]